MTTTVTATYANGVFTPTEPLDWKEGAEVTVSREDALPSKPQESILEIFDRLTESVPFGAWDTMPADGSMDYEYCLYGHPKVEAE